MFVDYSEFPKNGGLPPRKLAYGARGLQEVNENQRQRPEVSSHSDVTRPSKSADQ